MVENNDYDEILVSKPERNCKSFFKKLKAKKYPVLFSVCFVLLAGFFAFTHVYEIPLPFDAYRMSVETIPNAVIVDKHGETSWVELESAKYNGLVSDDYENVIHVLSRNYQGINGISESSVGRTINRDGDDVRVVYYCYSKPLWNSLFADSDLQEYSEGGRSTGTDMYGNNYQRMSYESQPIEVYYLPRRNLHKIDDFSDVEYDHLREECELIWSGVI